MTDLEKEELIEEICDNFCKYSEMLNQFKEEQALDMIRSISCERCPLDKLLKGENE